MVRQKKTGHPVKFEPSEHTRHAIGDYLQACAKQSVDYLFTGRRGTGMCLTTRQFARLFYVPGMQHCGGVIGTDRFDAFGALVDWVENGKAPGKSIRVTAGDKSLPMCSYPEYPKYHKGPENEAESYACSSK